MSTSYMYSYAMYPGLKERPGIWNYVSVTVSSQVRLSCRMPQFTYSKSPPSISGYLGVWIIIMSLLSSRHVLIFICTWFIQKPIKQLATQLLLYLSSPGIRPTIYTKCIIYPHSPPKPIAAPSSHLSLPRIPHPPLPPCPLAWVHLRPRPLRQRARLRGP